MKKFASRIFVIAMLVCVGCDDSSRLPAAHAQLGGLPVTHMQLGGQDFTLEVAGDLNSREVGLMHRDHLATDHGMLFLFPQVQEEWFWNHDVHFPLDVVFLDDKQTVVSVIHMDSYSEKNIGSEHPVKYAIELNAGTAQRLHLDVGTHLAIPPKALESLVPDK